MQPECTMRSSVRLIAIRNAVETMASITKPGQIMRKAMPEMRKALPKNEKSSASKEKSSVNNDKRSPQK